MNSSERFAIVIVCVSLVGLFSCSRRPDYSETRDPWEDQSFLVGVEYPWNNYGSDFGTPGAWSSSGVASSKGFESIDLDFGMMKRHGVKVVRWHLFADGRGSPEFDDEGLVYGFDNYFFDDVDAALRIARKNGISLIFVLFDHKVAAIESREKGARLGGRSRLITDPEVRRSFIDKALRPMLERYGTHRSILAWDVANLPEVFPASPSDEGGKGISQGEMRSFVKDVVDVIHSNSVHPVTLGLLSSESLANWVDCGLDFFVVNDPLEVAPNVLEGPISDGKRRILAGVPTTKAPPGIGGRLDQIRALGYSGAFLWSHQPIDDRSGFRESAGDLSTWLQQLPPDKTNSQ